ncbi:MAG: DUF3656 domain-containing U32 family peptidase [Coriobacteriales bacterium]
MKMPETGPHAKRTDAGASTGIPELLSPAGGPAQFYAALSAGADAIYCALGGEFNARRMSEGEFDDSSFAEACDTAHLLGAKVYATVNIVVGDDELGRALKVAGRALSLGADALIVQDWGFMSLIRENWPWAEVHVSTQCNVHDPRGVRWCADEMGASRVTLSRELSIDEISECCSTGIECEVFAHGAICVCYSGLCLMSSMRGGRSGNRGLCANPCRLPMTLVDLDSGRSISAPGNLRPLCPKDNCTIEDLDDLARIGVASLKLEGRLKDPAYVRAVTSAYRAELDKLNGEVVDAPDLDEIELGLRRVFNRGFTDAYLHGRSGNEIISYRRSNNQGDLVGEVVGSRGLPDIVSRRKGANGGRERNRVVTRAEVDVRLSGDVGAGDILEFRPDDAPDNFITAPVSGDAKAGQVITCIASREVPDGSRARLVRSQAALDAAANVQTADGAVAVRKRKVHAHVEMRLGQPLLVELETVDGAARASASGPVVESARTKAVSIDDLVEHVGRMGTTPFELDSIDVDLDDGCGMGFSAIHRVRAEACDELERQILEPWRERESMVSSSDKVQVSSHGYSDRAECTEPDSPEICVLAPTPQHAGAAMDAGATRVYATADALGEFPQGWPCPPIPLLDEICHESDHDRLDKWVEEGSPVAVGNVSGLSLAAERGASPEIRHTIPVHNTRTLALMESFGASGIWLSPELEIDQIGQLGLNASSTLGILAYGRVQVMTIEHCALQASGECRGNCGSCNLRKMNIALRDIDGNRYPVRTDAHGRSRIYHWRPVDLAPEVGRLLKAGVTRFLVDATLLDAEQVRRHVKRLVDAVARVQAGKPPLEREPGTDSARLHLGIE